MSVEVRSPPSKLEGAWRLQPSASSERRFLAACAIAFLASAYVTVRLCEPTCCGTVAMPGGWELSTMWIGSPLETWLGAAAEFLVMWTVMMVAMMLPSLAPMLVDYRRALGEASAARARATLIAGAGYFAVWTLAGVVVWPFGAALASAELRWPSLSRCVPLLSALLIAGAGVLQTTPWKSRQLLRCRSAACCTRPMGADARAAWRHGLALGSHCAQCCTGFMLALLALGAMELWAMAVIAAAMAIERSARAPARTARWLGALIIVVGAVAAVRAQLLP